MSDTKLDGATQPNRQNSYPANAGEFAARWNASGADEREHRLRFMIDNDQKAHNCFMAQHESHIADLRRSVSNLERLLEEAEKRRVRDVQSVLDQRDDLRDVIEAAYTGSLMVNGKYAADILGKVLPFD